MPTEIEAKYKLEDPDALRVRLEGLGAVHHGAVLETNRFFDWPDADLRRSDRGLRVRRAEPISTDPACPPAGAPVVTVTYKGPREKGPLKVREELEFTADDADAVAAVLAALGMLEKFLFEKRRDRWTLNDCELALDEVPHLGHFLEIEGPSGPAIAAVAELLGMEDAPVEPNTYTALLRTYARREGLSTRSITF